MEKKWALVLKGVLIFFTLFYLLLTGLLIPHVYEGDETHWLPFTLSPSDEIQTVPLQNARLQLYRTHFKKPLVLSFHLSSMTKGTVFISLRLGSTLTGKSVSSVKIESSEKSRPILLATHDSPALSIDKISPRVTLPVRVHQGNFRLTLLPQGNADTLYLLELGVSQHSPLMSAFLKVLIEQAGIVIKLLMGIPLLLWLLGLYQRRIPLSLSLPFFLLLATSYLLLRTYLTWNPLTGVDLAVFTAANPLATGPGGNLNYGLYMAKALWTGQGVLLNGHINWARMPGYGFVVALATLFAPSPHHLLEMALNTAFLQIFSYALAISFFFYANQKIISPPVAALISASLLVQSTSLPFVFIEAFIPTVMLVLLAISCLYLQAEKKHSAPPAFPYHLFLHLGFATWFFIRPDIAFAWFMVSLFLYAGQKKTWAYLLLPLVFSSAIMMAWGFYKMPYLNGSFSSTTETVGEVFMLGLWQVPNVFGRIVADQTYFDWIAQHTTLSPFSPEASRFTLKAVFHFYLTYPFYAITMVLHQFALFSRQLLRFILLLICFISLFIGYQRKRLLLLGWAVAFNLPLYFFTYNSGGRFFFPATASLLAAGIPCLFEKSFYEKVKNHLKITGAVLILGFGFYALSPLMDRWMLKENNFRYIPLIDPKHCLLCQPPA